jgi:hypothetical protein
MKTAIAAVAAVVLTAVSLPLRAQDDKPVPKDSVRVSIPGCSKGYMFTAGHPSEDQGATAVPQGMHLRMNGPKKLTAEIKAQEGSRIEITGLMKKGQDAQQGIALGRGVRIGPGPSGSGGGASIGVGSGPVMIDVEGWRAIFGDCPH